MPKVDYADITFDSPEEREMYWWCEEAKEYGLLQDFEYQIPTWTLAESVVEIIARTGKRGQPIKPKTRTILKAATYTCDFHLVGIHESVPVNEYLDIKPTFTRRTGDARLFEIKRKWLYQRHRVLVYSIVPWDLFNLTWCPAKAKLTEKTKQPRKRYCDLPTVEEFIFRTRCPNGHES